MIGIIDMMSLGEAPMWKPFAGVLAILLSVQANAAKRSWTQQDILHEMSSEFAYCASYYGISQTCAERSGAKELAKQLDAVGGKILEMRLDGFKFSEIASSLGISKTTVWEKMAELKRRILETHDHE